MTEDSPAQISDPAPDGEDRRSTHFTFSHAIFQFSGARFWLAADGTPSLVVPLGEIDVTMPNLSLLSEFKLDGTPDGQLLHMVTAGLRFVKIIRPGDSIPREILDGTASWTIDDRHHEIARTRLEKAIWVWMALDHGTSGQRPRMVDAAEIRADIATSLPEIAEFLGLENDEKEVTRRMDSLSRELAYIEALRERYATVRQINKKVAAFRSAYRRDLTIGEEILRAETLMRRPFEKIDSIFRELDEQAGKVVKLLRDVPGQIELIRKGRDDLHERMMLWDEMVIEWESPTFEASPANEILLRNLYRFLARNFNIRTVWARSTQGPGG